MNSLHRPDQDVLPLHLRQTAMILQRARLRQAFERIWRLTANRPAHTSVYQCRWGSNYALVRTPKVIMQMFLNAARWR